MTQKLQNMTTAIGAVLLASTAISTSAFAQTAAADDTAAQDTDRIEDIVVTARFRNERLQDIPLSVSAFSASTIQNSVNLDVQSIQKFLPNVQLSRISFSGNALGASIRGVSFADLEKTFDPAIGVSIDGVFLGTNTGANIDFSDIESIEVLRGPQGTLYGRNTIGGTISVRRTRPTGEGGFKFHARYGSFNALDTDVIVNLPKMGDAVSVKLFAFRRISDSFTRSIQTGKREDGRDYYNVGGSILFEAGDDTTILASLDYQKDRSEYPSVINLTKPGPGTVCNIVAGGLGCDTVSGVISAANDYRLVNTTIPLQSYLDGWNASLEFTTKLGDFALTAVTGYRDTRDSLLEENTGAPPIPVAPGVTVPLFVAARDQKYKQFSQEIRLSGNLTDSIDIVAGLYYLHTQYDIRPYPYLGARLATAYFFNSPAQSFTANQTLDSYAIFLESIIKLGSNVRLTVGGRYTTETKKFGINQTIPVATAFTSNLKKTFSDPTGRVILDWKPNEDMMLYASWSRGFRSGGFNGRGTSPTTIGPYDPERVDSFEAGLKADFLDGKLRFNPTVFWVEYNDKQEDIVRRPANNPMGTETIVENAAKARIRGVELEIQARPTPQLTLRASGGYLDPKYKAFLIPDLANPGQFLNVAGQRNFRRTPKYTLNAGIDYNITLSDADSLNLTVDYAFIDDIFATPIRDVPANRDIVPGYTSVDASISLLHTGDDLKNLRVSAFVRDMFNKGGRLSTTLNAGIFFFGAITPRRTFGAEATIAF